MTYLFHHILAAANETAKQGPKLSFQSFLPFILLIVIFYLIIIRPQKKKQQQQQERINSLKKGKKVITAGGIHGIVNHVGDTTISLKVNDNNVITIQKNSIITVIDKTTDSSDNTAAISTTAEQSASDTTTTDK